MSELASEKRDRSLPNAWCWLLPVAYAAHIAEEYFVGSGFHSWVGSWVSFSAPSFLGVNFMIISLMTIAVRLARTQPWASFLLVAVSVHFAIHGLIVHPLSTAWVGELSPGLVTGVVVLVPLAALNLRWTGESSHRRGIVWGVGAGILLFASQDLWRVLFNLAFPAPAA